MRVEPQPKDGDQPTSSRAIVPFVPRETAGLAKPSLRYGLWIAGLGLVIGLGSLGAHVVATSSLWTPSAPGVTTAQLLIHLQEDIGHLKSSVDTLRTAAEQGRQDDPLRGLKRSVDTLKQEIEQIRSADAAALTQLSMKIDKIDHDPAPKLGEIMARLDKIDHDPAAQSLDSQKQKIADQRIADLASRVDRVEHQVSSATPTASLAPAPVLRPNGAVAAAAKVSSVTPPKPDAVMAQTTVEPKASAAKPQTVDAWVVRDVYDGMALVEARRGGLREIEPGQFLPGAGEIRSIERRGRGWVVLTSRGVIETNTF